MAKKNAAAKKSGDASAKPPAAEKSGDAAAKPPAAKKSGDAAVKPPAAEKSGDAAAKPPAAKAKAKASKYKTVEIVLRRNMKIGETDVPIGTKIGEVQLQPGISLNYLVDAVRNGIAGMKKD